MGKKHKARRAADQAAAPAPTEEPIIAWIPASDHAARTVGAAFSALVANHARLRADLAAMTIARQEAERAPAAPDPREREALAEALDAALAANERAIANLHLAHAERDTAIADRDALRRTVAVREGAIDTMGAVGAEWVHAADAARGERDAAIRERDDAIAARDGLQAALHAAEERWQMSERSDVQAQARTLQREVDRLRLARDAAIRERDSALAQAHTQAPTATLRRALRGMPTVRGVAIPPVVAAVVVDSGGIAVWRTHDGEFAALVLSWDRTVDLCTLLDLNTGDVLR